jgi:hypothetical protein
MQNRSVETLLARHYGTSAVTPTGLEQRLCNSLQEQAAQISQQQRVEARPISRRRAVQIVALSSLGAGFVNLGLEVLENALVGQEATQNAAIR